MRRVFPLFIFSLIAFFSLAQPATPVSQTYEVAAGKYVIRYYAENIVKLTFIPKGYTRNVNLSGAVILQPLDIHPALRVNINEGIVSFNGKAVLIGADTMSGQYGFNFALDTGEMIFGGGERALPLNRRGHAFNLYNNPWYGYAEGAENLNYSVPFFTSSKGYGLFFDNPSRGFVDIGKQDENVFKAGFSSGELNVYVILGRDHREVLQSYHKLTGTRPLPPRWAFGNLMSRFGYTSEMQVKDILSKMNKEHIPVDAVIFDLFWFGDSIKGTLGNLEWVNKRKWPDPKRMIRDFRKQGINTILVTEPFFVESSRNYKASKKYSAVDSNGKPYYLTDFYFGRGGLIDIFRKDSRDWFWNFYKKQMNIGVEAWWGDLGEPEKHPRDLYHNLKDMGHKRLFAADEVHNIYGHHWTKMLYDKYAMEYPDKRLFSLNRSGFAGSQRYSIFPWTGDVSRSWSGLQAQLPVLLGMTMSGVPYVHSDAGGFAGGEGDNELYVRWLQFAAFTPIFRPHGTALYEIDPQAFSFPSEAALIDTPWRAHAKQAIQLRYSLLPYNYSLAYQHTRFGKPLMAPLYYYFQHDTTAVKVQNQFMWGENILVAAVIEKGIQNMKVYLPEGKWLQVCDNKVLSGGEWIEVKVNAGSIPLFIKEGGFIPRVEWTADLPEQYNTSAYQRSNVRLNYFPSSAATSFTWYEDDGASKNALDQENFTIISCRGQEKAGVVEVSLEPSNQKFLNPQVVLTIAGITTFPKAVEVNGKTIPVKAEDLKYNHDPDHSLAAWKGGESSLLIITRWDDLKALSIRVIK